MPFLIAAFGLAVGSFLNVVIGRIRSGERGWRNRSRCPDCHTVLRPSELVPVLSFMVLRAKCRSCKKPISWQYPIVELTTATLFVTAYAVRGLGVEMARDMIFICGLIVIFVIDLLDMVVYDSVTLPMLVFAFAVNLYLGLSWSNLAMAVVIGAGFFLLQWVVSKGRWIGGGDIRIGGMMGAMLGFPGIVLSLLLAYVIGAATAVGLLAAKKTTWTSQMAFGTFLTFAAAIVLFFGDGILRSYGAFF